MLSSQASVQRAVQESYCVQQVTEEGGVGICADGPDRPPRRLSVVRPRERVAIVLRGATAARGTATVRPLGKERVVLRFRVREPRTRWRVRLRPRAYEVEIFARFETADGRTGDTSATAGILVSRHGKLRIVRGGGGPALTG